MVVLSLQLMDASIVRRIKCPYLLGINNRGLARIIFSTCSLIVW
jgi:hypothetical protein